MGIAGPIRVLFGRCPECGTRLRRIIVAEESYVRDRPLPPLRGLGNIRATYTSAFVRQERVTPVDALCETCGYRRRLKNLIQRIA